MQELYAHNLLPLKYSNISLKKKKKHTHTHTQNPQSTTQKTYPLASGDGSRDCRSFEGPYSSPTTNKMHVEVE